MIVYHGSDSNFKKLRISQSLVKHQSTFDNEGLGIYFSAFPDIASSYGKYIYTLNINDQYLADFRDRQICVAYLQRIAHEIWQKTYVDITKVAGVRGIVEYMKDGGIAICKTCREIELLLDSDEAFHVWYSERKREAIRRILRSWDKSHLHAYFFQYHIRGVGVIKDVRPEVVQILDKSMHM